MPKVSAVLIMIVSILLGIGLVVLASVSGVRGLAAFNDSQYFIKRQLLWLGIAVIAGVCTAKIDYHMWRKLVIPISIVSIILIIIVLIPGIGTKLSGSRRWLRIGTLSFQPSELGKFALIILISTWISHIGRRVARYSEGLIAPLAMVGLFVLLIFAEPDYGTTMLVAAVGMMIMFVGGTRLSHLIPPAIIGIAGVSLAIAHNEVRFRRIRAFLDPEADPRIAYHLAQSKISFMHGGFWGVGYGNSIQKQLFLPEAHTDFIFAILGEELGLIMSLIVIILFFGILICGIIISRRAVDLFGMLLGFGITFLITMQAVINIGVVTGCLPTKGIALPFISYGGSRWVISVAAVCVLLTIARHTASGGDKQSPSIIKDSVHRK